MEVFMEQITQILLIGGFSIWLTVAVVNNIVDRKTNVVLLQNMLSMKLLKADPLMGNGLESRSIENRFMVDALLTVVVVVQLIIIVLMWCGTLLYAYEVWGGSSFGGVHGLSIAIIGIMTSIMLWFFFLCGGLYFGYWIKTPHLQQTHLAVLIVSLQILTYIS